MALAYIAWVWETEERTWEKLKKTGMGGDQVKKTKTNEKGVERNFLKLGIKKKEWSQTTGFAPVGLKKKKKVKKVPGMAADEVRLSKVRNPVNASKRWSRAAFSLWHLSLNDCMYIH